MAAVTLRKIELNTDERKQVLRLRSLFSSFFEIDM